MDGKKKESWKESEEINTQGNPLFMIEWYLKCGNDRIVKLGLNLNYFEKWSKGSIEAMVVRNNLSQIILQYVVQNTNK